MEEGILKGSGRSIEEYPMFDSLLACSDILIKFGGHPMAAGLTVAKERLEEFRERMNSACTLTEEDLCLKVKIDARMPLGYISERLIGQLELLEPCGKGNEKALFAAVSLQLISAQLIGRGRNMLRLKVRDKDGTVMDALPETAGGKGGRDDDERHLLSSDQRIPGRFKPADRDTELHLLKYML